jgi:transcriptional regulator with XRE-family HTH domain
MSQEELGWFAALHRTEIGLLERGARVPWIDTLIKVATALSVTPGSLLEGIGFDLGSETNGPSRPPSGAFTLSAEAE